METTKADILDLLRRPDIVELLRRVVDDLKQQLQLAEAALRAAEALAAEAPASVAAGGVSASEPEGGAKKRRSKIRWTKEVIALFKEHPGEELSIDDVCRLLLEREVPADNPRAKSNIQAALARQTGKTLERVRPGVYRWKKREEDFGASSQAESETLAAEDTKNKEMTSSDEEDIPF